MSALSDLNQLLLEGQLMAAVEVCKQAVRNQPAALEPRVALFELSIFLGDWDRCKNQVETIMSLGGDPMHWLGHLANVHAAKSRVACWQGLTQPPVVGACSNEDGLMIERLWAAIKDAASGCLVATEENAADFGDLCFGPGSFNGEPFASLATLDSRLPGILEISDGGEYAWLWLRAVSRIEMQGGATNLAEVLWIPARVFLTNGEVKSAAIFGLYPGTERAPQPRIVLGRETAWDEASETLALGVGGQLFLVDERPVPFQQVRLIEFALESLPEPTAPVPAE